VLTLHWRFTDAGAIAEIMEILVAVADMGSGLGMNLVSQLLSRDKYVVANTALIADSGCYPN